MVTPVEKEGVPQLTEEVNWITPWLSSIYQFTISPTNTQKITRVRVPPPIWCTYCCHVPSWDKPRVTSKHNLSTLSCVLICPNGTISRESGITTVDCREKRIVRLLMTIWRSWYVSWSIIMNKQNRSRTRNAKSSRWKSPFQSCQDTGDSRASYLVDEFLDVNS